MIFIPEVDHIFISIYQIMDLMKLIMTNKIVSWVLVFLYSIFRYLHRYYQCSLP